MAGSTGTVLNPMMDDDFSAFDLVGCSIFVVEQDQTGEFHLIHLNHATRLRLGDAADSIIGPVRANFPPRVALRLIRNYEAAMRSADPVVMNEVLAIEDFDGHWRTILKQDPNHPARVIGCVFETSDLEERALMLSHKLAEAHARLDEMRTMAGLTAHDTRAPLANVVSLLDLALEDFSDLGNGKTEILAACRHVAFGALGTIESLMARVGNTAPAGRPLDTIDFGQLCRQIAAIVDPIERIRITHPEGSVMGDHVILQASMRNLLDNAARYAKNQIEITVRSGGPEMLDIVIADDGPGFPKDQRCLEPAGKVARIDGGRGYGLPAVAQLLSSHGGSLEALPSRFGVGATLRIRLPGDLLPAEYSQSA